MKLFSKKYFIFGIIIGIVLLTSFLFTLPDGKLHLVFCNVGQGDAAYIRTASGQDMLIDGGPDDKVLSCLGSHMPFYDRAIDVVVLSHPQKDHLQGLISVLERYSVKYFVIGVEGNTSASYQKLVSIVKEKNIPIKNLYTGDTFSFGQTKFTVFWPQKEWVAGHTLDLNMGGAREGLPARAAARQSEGEHGMGEPSDRTHKLQSGAVLGLSTDSELNDFSYFIKLSYGSFDALFPGDGDSHIQPEVLEQEVGEAEVLKVPHHGSKTGMLPEFLDTIKPTLAIISVGKNSYGHPTAEALKLLSERNIKVQRTDREGDIEIVSDGRNWRD